MRIQASEDFIIGWGGAAGGQAIAHGVRRGCDWQEETSGLGSMTEGLVSDGSEEVSRG